MNKLMAYIYTSNRCNLSCKYCYVNYEKDIVNTRENIFKYINLLFTDPYTSDKDIIDLGFLGGEPFIEIDLLEYSIDTFIECTNKYNKWKDSHTFSLTTNGTLLHTPRAQNLIKKYPKLNIALSLDGPKKIHNKNRVYHNGNGSFEQVIYNFNLVKDSVKNTRVDSVLTGNNIDNLSEILLFQEELNTNSIGINLDYSYNFTKDDVRKVQRQSEDVFDILINKNKEFSKRIFGLIKEYSYIWDIDNYKPLDSYCGFCKSIICLHPNGKIYPDQILASSNSTELTIGDIDTGIDIDKVYFVLNKVKDESFCKRCRFNFMCNRCTSLSYDKNSNKFTTPKSCNMTKIGYILMRKYISKIINNIDKTVKFV